MASVYENLKGETGRKIFYRAERFPAKGFFKGDVPSLSLGATPCRLGDLSMSGIAALNDDDASLLSQGDDVAVKLTLSNRSLFEGRGRIVRVEPTFHGSKLGVEVTSGAMDLRAMLADYQKIRLGLGRIISVEESRLNVSKDYRAFTADVLNLFRSYRGIIDEFMTGSRVGATDSNGAGGPEIAAITSFLDECENDAIPAWRKLCAEGVELISNLTEGPKFRATKSFTEAVLTPETLVAPIQTRAYEKPLGYPGDYQVMNYVYNWRREGDTPYAQFMHRLALEPIKCVATRMNRIEKLLSQEISTASNGAPCRITNLACGTAQEIQNLLGQPSLSNAVEITLIDQEENTLAYAYEHTLEDVRRHKDQARVQCWHASFRELMKAGDLFERLPPQDVIYSVGLLDYLRDSRAKGLIKTLFNYVAPGGVLVVANVKTGGLSMWPSEYITDWSMIYRTADQVRDLVDGLPANVQIEEDELGEILFLTIRKPNDA
jgi:hypothetical protein